MTNKTLNFRIKEIELKKAFKVHRDYNIEEDFRYPYHLTPYQGCAFQCVYCFNYKNPKYWKNIEDKQSQIVVAKNIVDLVRQELTEITRSSDLPLMVRIGTSAEIYGPAEEEYRITRGILEEFAKSNGWHIRIPTKSDLVLRDIDLLQQLDCLVTITLTTTSEDYASKLEPKAPTVAKRLEVLKELRKKGIRSRIRCEPYLEGISDVENMLRIKEELGLEEVKVKKLNYYHPEEILKYLGGV